MRGRCPWHLPIGQQPACPSFLLPDPLQPLPPLPPLAPRARTQPQVALRRRAGIRADSKLEILAAEQDMCVARCNGNVTLKLGPRYDMGGLVPRKEEGWRLVQAGNEYAVWEKVAAA